MEGGAGGGQMTRSMFTLSVVHLWLPPCAVLYCEDVKRSRPRGRGRNRTGEDNAVLLLAHK
jgi:hypothetical protein